MWTLRLKVIGLAGLLLVAGLVQGQEPEIDTSKSDEETLREAKIAPDGPGLLAFLRSRTLNDKNLAKVKELVAQLGDKNFRVRERATNELLALGPVAMPVLKEAIKDPDPEVARRARQCLDHVEKGPSAAIASAALRHVGRLKPAGAAVVLLDYAPAADDEYVLDEVRNALTALSVRDGKTEKPVLDALADSHPIRRAIAAEALCRANAKHDFPAVSKLLQDKDAPVRLRVALALAERHEKQAIPVLIELLAELPMDLGWQAEGLLYRLAGEEAPQAALGSEEAERKKCRDAWDAWWQKHGANINLARLSDSPRLMGITLLAQWDNGNLGTLIEFGPDNKERWKLPDTPWPLDVQILQGNRLLLVEYYDGVIAERNREGKLLWKHSMPSPLYAHRLPNGNTFMANASNLIEVDRAGKEVLKLTLNNISSAQKLPNGRIAYISNDGVYHLLDAAGKELKSFKATNVHGYGAFQVLANGSVIIPGNNKVMEFDANGKKTWEANAASATAVYRVPNGNTLVACRDAQVVLELNRKGEEVWKHKSAGFPWRIQRR